MIFRSWNFRSARPLLLVVSVLASAALHAQQPVPPAYFNALQWRLIGPFRAGRVVAVTGVPGSATEFYFGSVDGGVWKSSDAGAVWKPVFDSQPIASIGAIAVAPSNSQVLYAGTGESDIRSDLASGDGVYRSTDSGHTWKNIGLRHSRQISRILVDPAHPDTVYAGVLGDPYGPSPERGVYQSTDGGSTWKHILDKGPAIGISDMAIATAKPNILFAAAWNAHRPPWSTYAPLEGPGSGLYRSTDGGRHWSRLTGNGLPAGDWGRPGVAVSPDGARVYALIDDRSQSGLYRSDDGGNHWTRVNSDPRLTSRAWYFNRVTIDPSHPDTLYVPNVALYRSQDGGKSISIVRGAPGGDDYHELWIDPANSDRMILGTDQGATISLNHGETWSTWYNQPTAQFYHVITDNQYPYAVYGAQQDSGSAAVFSRTDHGQITPRDWFQPGSSESGYIALDPDHPEIVYETDTFGDVLRFNRTTSLSQNITPWPTPEFDSEIFTHKYRDPWTPVLVFSPDLKTLYLGTQYVLKTTDGGLHWQPISPDLTGAAPAAPASTPVTPASAIARGYGVVFTLAPSRPNPQEIWAGSDTGRIHLTRNGGAAWSDVTPPGLPAWSKISMIEASRFNPAVAYAAIDRRRMSDTAPYLYRTRDYGKSWQRIDAGIPAGSFLRAVREDSVERNLLFAGTELGVYVSFDRGDHWQSLQQNLPVSSVRDLAVHGDDLVIATHGRAFWILDDITPLRQAAAAAQQASSADYFYQPQTAIRIDNDAFQGTPLPPEEPTAKSPPAGAVLDYVLKSPAKGVVLLIVAPDGRSLVRHFSSEDSAPPMPTTAPIAERWFPEPGHLQKSAGMHRFVWDLHWSSSGAPAADGDSGQDDAAPPGPRVAPGIYQAKLTVDGHTSIRPITVTMDPRSSATPAILAAQQELGLRLYSDLMRSRRALAEMESVHKQLVELQPKVAHDPGLSTDVKSALRLMAEIEEGDAKLAGLHAGAADIAAVFSVVEGGDRAVPAQATELYQQTRTGLFKRLDQWDGMKEKELPQLDKKLSDARMPLILLSQIEEEVSYQMNR